MKHLFIAIVLFISYGVCYAAPDISLINTTGTTIHIEGTGFGTNTSVGTSKLQFLNDNIESSSNNDVVSATGWDVYTPVEGPTEAVPRYSTELSHSGNQSIKIDYIHDDTLNRYKGHFYWDYGSAIKRAYISFWVIVDRYDPNGEGQWKIWRIKNIANNGFENGSLDFVQVCFHPNSADGTRIASLFVDIGTTEWDCNGCPNEPSTGGIYLGSDQSPGPSAVHDRWVRMEYWIDVGTLDNYDGTFVYTFHDPYNPSGGTIEKVDKLTFENNLMMLKTGDGGEDLRYILFGGAAVDGLDLLVYWDDVFIQVGSWARVEIGNASTWSACTHREVVKPTAWSDTSITAIADDSVFSYNDNLYLFVVNDDGTVSNGYPIKLFEGGVPLGGNSHFTNIGTGASKVTFK